LTVSGARPACVKKAACTPPTTLVIGGADGSSNQVAGLPERTDGGDRGRQDLLGNAGSHRLTFLLGPPMPAWLAYLPGVSRREPAVLPVEPRRTGVNNCMRSVQRSTARTVTVRIDVVKAPVRVHRAVQMNGVLLTGTLIGGVHRDGNVPMTPIIPPQRRCRREQTARSPRDR
jgi:hypothetical protein